jgi:hypothetical protein
MNANLLNVLKQITADYGEEVLGDSKRLKALFSDLAKDEPKPLRTAFGKCVESGFYRILKDTTSPEERREVIESLARRLRDEEGLDITRCAEALELLAAAIFDTADAGPAPVCAGCGAELKANSKFCSACGTPVQGAQEVEVPPAPVCAGCGAELKAHWKVCPECGTPVQAAQEAEVPPTPAAPVSPPVQQPYQQPAPEPVPPPVSPPVQQPYQPPVSMIVKYSFASLIALSIITFGIYSLYWIHRLAKDVNAMCEGDGKKTAGLPGYFFLNLITLGVYGLVWVYMLGNRLHDNAPRYNRTFTENGVTVLLWSIPGLCIIVGPFIAWYIIIKNTNALADAYNKTRNKGGY